MTEKRYFKVEYDEEWYLFDNNTISEELVKEQAEYGYGVFANSLSPSEIVGLLNTLHQENEQLKYKLDFQLSLAETKIKNREKENEQLRHQIEIEKKWQLEKDRYYVKIKEENEQLIETIEKLRWDLDKTKEDLDFFATLKVTAMKGSEPMEDGGDGV